MPSLDQIDSDAAISIGSPEFAVRFGRLLTTTRRRSSNSIKDLSASSRLGFDTSQLKQFERGSAVIDESIVEALCLLYAADVGQVLPGRRPVTISGGRLFGPGASVEFSPDDPTSLLLAYLRLIRRMRSQRMAPAVALRRDDILVISGYLAIDGADVVERLSTLMHASPTQRTTMAMLFATGAIVIGLTAGGQASADDTSTASDASDPSVASELVVAEVRPDLASDTELVVIADVAATTASVTSPTTQPVAESPDGASSVPATTDRTSPVVAQVRTPDSPPASAPEIAPTTAPVTPPVTVPKPAAVAEITTTIGEPTPMQNMDQSPPPSLTESPPVVEAASGAVIDQVAGLTELSPATRLQVPEAATPATTVASDAPTSNQSGCNPDPLAAVMRVAIPDIAYSCPVYAGGQSMIDAGFVTLVTEAGVNPVLATRPGDPGTLWLAGHRSTHGAAFSRVPDLADGALVTVTSDGSTATYRVVGRSYFEVRGDRVVDATGEPTAEATWASVIRDDLSGNLAPRLVLQTCEGENFRWMIYADLVT